MERWSANYPNAHKEQLKRRMVADDFDSAFFELLLHELLVRLKLDPTVEPERAGRRPDFLCQSATGPFAIEAAVVTAESASDRGQRAVQDVLLDAINEVDSPDYFFEVVDCDVKGPQQPSSKQLSEFLRDKLRKADYETMLTLERSGMDCLPSWVFEDDRIRLVVRPIPKYNARGKPGLRPIGIYPVEGGWVRTKDALRRRLAEKAKKLRSLDLPIVLAVNSLSKWGHDHEDAVDALFGSEQVVVDLATRGTRPSRARDGFWVGPKRPINTRVSAVLVTSVMPWTASRASLDLFFNPWAKHPVASGALPFRKHTVVDEHLNVEEGLNLGAVLGLPPTWPEKCD